MLDTHLPRPVATGLDGFIPWPAELAAAYRQRGYWRSQPLGELLRQACTAYAERTAVVDADRRLTYRELDAAAAEMARRFGAIGIRPLDRVVVHLPNVAEFASVVIALFRMGAIPVLALPAHRMLEIVHLATLSEAVGYVGLAEFGGFDYQQLAHQVQQAVPYLTHVMILDGAAEAEGIPGPEDIAANPDPDPASVDPSLPALLLLSGGSTGLPKLIPRTHDDYAYNARATAAALHRGPTDTYLAVNPVAHNAALGCPGLLGTLLTGGKVVLTSSARPDEAFALIEEEHVTLTTLVPPLVRLWLEAARRKPVELPGLVLQVGSSKLDPNQARDVLTLLSCRLTQWFGVGEGLLTYTRLNDPEEVVCTTEGRPLCADDEVRVVDAEDAPVPEGEVGQLLCRGPYTIRGYFRADEANARAFTTDGFFRTGDLVRRRPDGNIVVVGRLKDVINRAGDKVPAEEVEEQLRGHPGVRDAALVGIADAVLGERTYAFITAAQEELDAASLKTFLREQGMADFKVPDRVVMLPDLPRTAVGKIDKTALRESLGRSG